jgi:flagellar basal-body rod protein FlgG
VQAGADGKVDPRNIGVVDLNNPRKVGDNLIAGQQAGASQSTVVGGSLEGSGADPAQSMVDMIGSFRAFEASQKVIRTLDDTLQLAAGKLGSLT